MNELVNKGLRAPLLSLSSIPFSLLRHALPALGLIVVLLAAAWLPARAQSLPGGPPASQITGRIDENSLTRLPGNTHPLARAAFDAGPVPAGMPQNHILMMLRRSPQRDQALRQFMSEQYDPHSPSFHKWLTPGQFGELYGPSPEDVAQVAAWLTQHGFVINRVPAGGAFIDFSGTAGQVETAFHTGIRYYRVGRETHFANAGDPMIPSALAPLVSGFRALNNFHPRSHVRNLGIVRRDPATKRWTRLAPGNLTGGSGADAVYLVGPQDLARIYGVDQVWQQSPGAPDGSGKLVGTGQTIGVAGDTNLDAGDIAAFRDEFGTTALGPNGSVVVDNPPTSVCSAPDASINDPEGYLDAEWSGAMAPDATIDFVACGDQGVTSGADLASAYIVDEPAHAQKIGVLSTSYGYCEANPISESDQFYVALWQQAAAEGITVVVATGDSGGAECDEFTGVPYAVAGAAVDAEASTPYNVAAGGSDFSDVFSGTTANYWSASNGPNLESAQSYIPETVWNDSCANPLILATFGQGFTSSSGSGGFCTWASQQPVDPDTAYSPYFSLFAGSGGLSAVSAKPSWQAGVQGIPAGNARALPDISMFASSGFAWGHALLLCDSAILPPGGTCDFSDPNNLYASSAGGTSFAAPAFAGIMALIDQKSGRQGQANNVLYPLAGQQYTMNAGSGDPSLATCAAYLGAAALPSCYFHDISSTPNPNPATQQQTPFLTGTTAVPCTGTATAPGAFTDASIDPASNSENCYGYEITVTQSGSSLTTTPGYYGILSTAGNAASPAFAAAPGYDLATGLGSPNAAALVNAPAWSGSAAPIATSTTLSSSSPTAGTGMSVTFTAAVTGAGGVPTGTVTFYNGSSSLGPATLTNGSATLTTSFGAPGTATIEATYGGDANFAASTSPPLPETIVTPGFTVSANPAALTIPFAGSGTVTFTLTSQGGFTGPVNFSCGELPKYFFCTFAKPALAWTAAGGALTNTLTIHAATATAAAAMPAGGSRSGIMEATAFWAPLSVGLLVCGRGKRRKTPLTRIWMVGLLCAGCAGFAAMSGCGRPDHQAPAGAYSVPINLTSPGGASKTVNVVVNVGLP